MRVIPQEIKRARWRTTLTYRFLPTLTAGVEYNPLAANVSPLMNWLAVEETLKRPALIVGTSSDRIGTKFGQSYYATFSKNLKRETRLPIAPYLGLAYGTNEDKLRVIGGVSVGYTEQWQSLFIFDGVHLHPTVSYSRGRHVLSLIMVRGHEPGLSYSISF